MMAATVPTVLWWSTGARWLTALAVMGAWILMFGWWVIRPPRSVWGPMAFCATSLACQADGLHLAFRLEQDCLAEKAEAAFEMDSGDRGSRRIETEGACGLVDYIAVELIDVPEITGMPGHRVVVFHSAGAWSNHLFSGADYVYSPDFVPQRCHDVYSFGDYTTCEIDHVTGDWYRVDVATSFN